MKLESTYGGGSSAKRPRRVNKAAPAAKRKGTPIAKSKAPARKAPHVMKSTGSRSRAPRSAPRPSRNLPKTQAAAQVGINAYRDYANSMTNLARTGIRGPGFQMPNLNPFDYLGQGLGALGDAVSGAVRGIPNPGQLIMEDAEAIRRATRR